MEAKSYLKILFLSFSFLFIYSCTKTQGPPQLPPATHTGANVVACKVNGKVFIATGNFGNTGLGVSYVIYLDSITYIRALGDSLYNTNGGNNFRLDITSKYIGIGTDSIINIPYSPGGGIYDDYYYTTIPLVAELLHILIMTEIFWQAHLLLMQPMQQELWYILLKVDLILQNINYLLWKQNRI